MISRLVCGEIAVEKCDKGFRCSHRDDSGPRKSFASNEARELARFDEGGNFRPLKTAPNLRRGWEISARDEAEVFRVLEQFYPGRLPVLAAFRAGNLRPTPLRETLGRQTGMYRAAAKISDSQADEVVGRICRSEGGCLRTILWRRDGSGSLPCESFPREKYEIDDSSSPLLCQEACAILLEACRAATSSGR